MTNQELLHKLNQKVLGDAHSCFREHPVYAVARDGRRVSFANWQDIPKQFRFFMDQFDAMFCLADQKSRLAQVLAYFWLTFIAIHPFRNGNGRTAAMFLIQKASEKGYTISRLELLKSILLEGNIKSDLNQLNQFFFKQLTKGETHE